MHFLVETKKRFLLKNEPDYTPSPLAPLPQAVEGKYKQAGEGGGAYFNAFSSRNLNTFSIKKRTGLHTLTPGPSPASGRGEV
jgi:hypothetical protein